MDNFINHDNANEYEKNKCTCRKMNFRHKTELVSHLFRFLSPNIILKQLDNEYNITVAKSILSRIENRARNLQHEKETASTC